MKSHPSTSLWHYTGRARPEWAREPGPGQESVWDYPRPPRIVPDAREILVRIGELELAHTCRSVRVLETASPPTFYLPPQDVRQALLAPAQGTSHCEWKGDACYFDFVSGASRVPRIAWTYPDPCPGFDSIRGWIGFFPSLAECFVDGERVRPQPGGFYGGWLTDEIVGPVKGNPGSSGW